MGKTTNVFARVEPELKESAEDILGHLGIPMSNAIGIFLKQVVLHRGLPFEVSLPVVEKPVGLQAMSAEAIYARLDSGYEEHLAGKSRPMADVFAELEQE